LNNHLEHFGACDQSNDSETPDRDNLGAKPRRSSRPARFNHYPMSHSSFIRTFWGVWSK